MSKYKNGEIVFGCVTGIEKYGIFVNLDEYYSGLIHISEVSSAFVRNIHDYVKVGETIKVKVLEEDEKAHQVKLSIKDFDYRIGKKKIEKIQESINLLKSNVIPYEFRTTIVKEFHNEEDIKKISHLIKGASKYYLQKFVNGENCIEKDLNSIDKETALAFVEILKNTIEKVELRGY